MATVKYVVLAHYIASKAGKTGLTTTVDIDEWNVAAGTVDTAFATAQAMTEARNGLYYRFFDGDDGRLYSAVVKTADSSVDQQHLAAIVVRLDRINTTLLAGSYTAPLDSTATQAAAAAALTAYDPATGAEVAALADAILDDEEVSVGVTVREALAAAGSAADPLTNPVSGYTAPQAGYYLQRLANNQVELVSVFDPVTMALRFRYGDDYLAAEDRAQTFTTELDLTGASVNWNVLNDAGVVQVTCTVVDAVTYQLEVTADDLEDIGVGTWRYDFQITLANGHEVTEVAGMVTVARDVR